MPLRLVKANAELEGIPGKTDSLDELYERYAGDVKRWAARLAGPRADVEDLLHDVFVIALRRHFTFRGDAHVRTWLFRITSNVVRARRRRGVLRGLLFRRHQEDLPAPGASPATPQDEIERRERCDRLYRALDQLPERYRTALILFEIERLPGEEVALLTGTSLGTVWVHLHRGRSLLAKYLGEEEP